jgi:hypothetical protein
LVPGRGYLVATFNGQSDRTDTVTVVSAQPSQLWIAAVPETVTAGVPFQTIDVQARDQINNLVDYTASGNVIWQVEADAQFGTRQSPYGYDVTMPASSQQFSTGTIPALNGSFRFVSTVPQRVRVGIVYGPGDTLWSNSWSNWIAVVPGSGYKTEIRRNRDNKSSWDPAVTQTVDETLTFYSGLYDSLGNYAHEVTAWWTSENLAPVVNVSDSSIRPGFTGLGTGYLFASAATYQGDTVAVTVNGGEAVRFAMRVLTGGGGVNDSTVRTAQPFWIEVQALDRGGNVARNYSGVKQLVWWWVSGDTIDEVNSDTAVLAVSGGDTFYQGVDTARGFMASSVGRMEVAAADTENRLGDTLGFWATDGTSPGAIDSISYSRDLNADGYLDCFEIAYRESLQAGTFTGAGGFTITSNRNVLTVTQVEVTNVLQGAVKAMVRLYCSNSRAVTIDTETGWKLYTDTDYRPAVVYHGGGVISDLQHNDGEVRSIPVEDGAGPVVVQAEYNNGGTEAVPDDDYLEVRLSEQIDDASWQVYAGDVTRVIKLDTTLGRRFGTGARLRDPGDPVMLVVELGAASAGAMELLAGVDSISLVDSVLADAAGNRAGARNQPMVIHSPLSVSLLMDVASYPNPLRAGGTQASGPRSPIENVDVQYGGLIKYKLNRQSDVDIRIFSPLGVLVLSERLTQGSVLGAREGVNLYYWNGSNGKGRFVESGSYLLVLQAAAGDKKDKKTWKIGVVNKK